MKTKYEELLQAVKANVKEKGSSIYSKSDNVNLTHAMINSPEYTETVVTKSGDGVKEVDVQPVKKYRNSLKPIVKQFGVDKEELGKLDDMQFSKEHAEAIVDLAGFMMKNYMDTGRKLNLPLTRKDESQMGIQIVEVKEKVTDTKKIEKQNDGTYVSVPTGKRVKTKTHNALKATNKVPAWLKEEVK